MKKSALAILFMLIANIGFSWQVKLARTIPIDDRDLLIASCFAPLENGSFLFTDLRDKDHQVKVFDKSGKLIKAWGRMGRGPTEFFGAGYLDYQSPYLAIADAGQHQVHVFEKKGDYEFKKIGDLQAWELESQIRIYRKSVLLCGFIVSSKGSIYCLFMRDFNGQATQYVLPAEKRFGDVSTGEYKRIKDEVEGLSNKGFMDIYQDTAFFVSDVRLRVAKIDLKTMRTEFFGREPEDFRALSMDKKTKNTMMDHRTGKEFVDNIRATHSFISGIFADKDFVGVIYANKDKSVDNELFYAPRLQIYDHSGNLRHEQTLAPFYTEQIQNTYYYQKEKRRLFLLSQLSDESRVNYTLYEFSIEP